VTPRYVAADPFEGGKQAVAECWRNLTAVGAQPLAVTDNLNFGNPERPEIMGQFVRAIQGIGEACRALDFPIVSGNVSLYNETNGEAILPTPTIGGVGLLSDWRKSATLAFKAEREMILLAGAPPDWGTHLGQSLYLREVHGLEAGAPPPVDLAQEKRVGDFVRGLVADDLVTAVHDLSDGGLAVGLAEMALASGIGADCPGLLQVDPIAFFFGEDQGRYLLTVRRETDADADEIWERAEQASIFAPWIGSTGGDSLILGDENVPGATTVPLELLRECHEGWFPAFMGDA
jgi:phosphoribosylformylglycinamidine synthase